MILYIWTSLMFPLNSYCTMYIILTPTKINPLKQVFIYKNCYPVAIPLSPRFDKHILPSGGQSRNWPILSCGQNDALPQNANSHTCIINHWPVWPRRVAWRKRTPHVASQIFKRVIFFYVNSFCKHLG